MITLPDLLDLGLMLVFMIVAFAVAMVLGLWMKGDSRRRGRRGRRQGTRRALLSLGMALVAVTATQAAAVSVDELHSNPDRLV